MPSASVGVTTDTHSPERERARQLRELLRSGDLDAVGMFWRAWSMPDATTPAIVRREWVRAAIALHEDEAALHASFRWYYARADFDAPTLVHAGTAAKRLRNEMALATLNRLLEDIAPENPNVVLNRSVLAQWALAAEGGNDKRLARVKGLALRCLRLASKGFGRSELATLLARIEAISVAPPADRRVLDQFVAIANDLEEGGRDAPLLADGLRNLRAALAWAGHAVAPVEIVLNPRSRGVPEQSDDLLGGSLASAISELHLGGAAKAAIGDIPRHPLQVPELCMAFQDDVDAALAPWRSSEVYESFRLAETERRAARIGTGASDVAGGERLRVLVVSANWNFTAPLVQALEDADWCEVRTFDLRLLASTWAGPTLRSFFPPSPDEGIDSWRQLVSASGWGGLFDDADLCVVDWCNEEAVQLSKVLRPGTRMVVRLHSYEAFTAIPYFMNWGGVDGMIYVSEPIRRFFFDQHQERLEGIPWIVAGNAMSRVSVPSSPRTSGGRTLGMLKFADANKDPIAALNILSALRKEDPAWSLRLAGDAWPDDDSLTQRELEYKNDFFAFIGAHALDGAVVYDGYQDDPMAWLRGVDFILSCSQREGTHEALLDGVAAGCTPVIRDWPMLARYGGPKALYPELSDWVFSTTEEAVELITSPRSAEAAPPHPVLEVGDSSPITEFLRAVAVDDAAETVEPDESLVTR